MLAITTGEPAGIGPDICLSLVNTPLASQCVLIGSQAVLQERAKQLGLHVIMQQWDGQKSTVCPANTLLIDNIECAEAVVAGQLNSANAAYVLATLDCAITGCQQGRFDAMVTAPVHKGIINDAGISFSGHTEYLAASTDTDRVVMMLATQTLRVALVTTHLALSDVPRAITTMAVEETIRIVHHDLQQKFGIRAPKILLCGLNPHAGEDGHMGREEIDTINPVAKALQAEGIDISLALPADTAFTPRALGGADAVIAMYHDQGLPVLKAQGFGEAVNITLGLPINRSSVDHGTALDLAGLNQADNSSLLAAIEYALQLQPRA